MNNNNLNNFKCIKCGFDFSNYMEPNFCPKCGTSVYNYCPKCNPQGIKDYEDITQVLPSNDPFCYICGSKTIFYNFLIDKSD